MEARLCELYKSAAEYEILERSLYFDIYRRWLAELFLFKSTP